MVVVVSEREGGLCGSVSDCGEERGWHMWHIRQCQCQCQWQGC